MRRALLVALALAAAAGCDRPQARLRFTYDLRADGGGPGVCEQVTDLGCVNFVRFQLSAKGGTEILTNCVKADQRLTNLCDVEELGRGAELFNRDPDDNVVITMEGLRVFPATTCEITAACPPRELFSGIAGPLRVGDHAGGTIDLTVNRAGACGDPEEFRQPSGTQTCDEVCETFLPGNRVVCPPPGSGIDYVEGGCVCAIAPRPTDAGVARE
jgi:hypothetical protein